VGDDTPARSEHCRNPSRSNHGKLTTGAPPLPWPRVPGRHSIKDLWDASIQSKGKVKMKTVEGDELTFQFKDQTLWIWDSKGNTARVTIQNVNQSNGVIHVIDTVLMPS
jgi:hypothetical protein